MISRDRKAVAAAITASLVLFFSLSAVHSFSRRGKCIIAVLGWGSNAAAVISCGGHTDVVDITGNYRNGAYVSRYLAVNGINEADNVLLAKNADIQYELYSWYMRFVKMKNCFAVSGAESMEGNISGVFDEKGISVERNGESIVYSEGKLCISYMGENVVIMPANENIPEGAAVVCYGRMPEYTNEDIIYLQQENNFEIILSDKGGYKRRL